MITDFNELTERWQAELGAELSPPASTAAIQNADAAQVLIPESLKAFYDVSNGLSCNWFSIFPVEDASRVKQTWDGIVRNNQKYNNAPPGFVLFATLGEGNMAYIKLDDESIWFDEPEGLAQTDLTLAEFIQACLLDAQ